MFGTLFLLPNLEQMSKGPQVPICMALPCLALIVIQALPCLALICMVQLQGYPLHVGGAYGIAVQILVSLKNR